MGCLERCKRKTSLALILIIVLVLVQLLSACAFVGYVPNAAPSPEPEVPMTLSVTGAAGYGVPVVSGPEYAAAVNTALEAYAEGLNECLANTNSGREGGSYSLDYTLFYDNDGGYTIAVTLISPESLRVAYSRIKTDKAGAVTITDFCDSAVLSDGDFLDSFFYLITLGVTVDMSLYGSSMRPGDICTPLVQYYEHVAGKKIDVSKVAVDGARDDVYKKALVISATYYDSELYYDDFYPTGCDLPYTMTNIGAYIEQYALCRWGESVDCADAAELVSLYLRLMLPATESGDDWNSFINSVDLNVIAQEETATIQGGMTRGDLARFFWKVYLACFGEAEETADGIELRDSDDPYVRAVMARYLMVSFPCYGFFTPDYPVTRSDLHGLVQTFVSGIYEKWNSLHSGAPYAEEIRYERFIGALCDYARYFEAQEACTVEHFIVNNGGDNSWYTTQYDDSEYAYVNCMPTISCMGIKWVYPESSVTPDELRRNYPDITGGWYLYQVEEQLTRYGVACDYELVSIDNITAALDDGCIILATMSEAAPEDEAHCFVLYGYETFGETMVFYVNDPGYFGYFSGLNQYGEPGGKGRVIDSKYCMFIMDRHNPTYLKVYPPAQ